MQAGKVDEGAFLSNECRDQVQLYAVCDGMGGADSGEDASYKAVRELAHRKQEYQKWTHKEELTKVLRTISDDIYKEAAQKGQKSGTTVVMMLVAFPKVVLANVGDSRIYRFRGRKLTQVSLDHSKVQRMISMGLLTPEQAKTDPSRHVITQYLGMPSEIKVSPHIVSDITLQKGDVYVLCSDGLTDMVEDEQLEAILREKEDPREAVQALFQTAMNHGGRDNVTIMLLFV
jgi:serine/threonine protein phosphatase PrpC